MTKGLYLSLKYVFSKFEEVLYTFDRTSIDSFILDMRRWVTTFDFFEFNNLYLDLIKAIESLRIFMINMTEEYFSFIIWISSLLFIYSMLSLILVFLLCWLKFFKFVDNSLRKTR